MPQLKAVKGQTDLLITFKFSLKAPKRKRSSCVINSKHILLVISEAYNANTNTRAASTGQLFFLHFWMHIQSALVGDTKAYPITEMAIGGYLIVYGSAGR